MGVVERVGCAGDRRRRYQDGCGWGAKWLQACALAALGEMMSGEVGESRGVRERASLCGEQRGCSLPSACSPLQTRILPGHDQDRSGLYRLRTTRPALMPAVFLSSLMIH